MQNTIEAVEKRDLALADFRNKMNAHISCDEQIKLLKGLEILVENFENGGVRKFQEELMRMSFEYLHKASEETVTEHECISLYILNTAFTRML
jgi:hypothetical protein